MLGKQWAAKALPDLSIRPSHAIKNFKASDAKAHFGLRTVNCDIRYNVIQPDRDIWELPALSSPVKQWAQTSGGPFWYPLHREAVVRGWRPQALNRAAELVWNGCWSPEHDIVTPITNTKTLPSHTRSNEEQTHAETAYYTFHWKPCPHIVYGNIRKQKIKPQ